VYCFIFEITIVEMNFRDEKRNCNLHVHAKFTLKVYKQNTLEKLIPLIQSCTLK